MKLRYFTLFVLICACVASGIAFAQSKGKEVRDAALQRLKDSANGAVAISTNKATGAARFIRFQPGANAALGFGPAKSKREKQEQSLNFFRSYGEALGISDARSMRLVSDFADQLGETHLTWKQFHGNVPVFAGTIKTHFDASGQLKAVTGTAIPDIEVSSVPSLNSQRAGELALKSVIAERGKVDALTVGNAKLYIFREGLAKGVPGDNHLAWEIEVTNGSTIRDMVYIDAHSGKFIDRITAIQDDLDRRVYDGHDLPFVPNNYPSGPYWEEGENFPTNSTEANNMIIASEETYNIFFNAFGRDSFDDAGTKMDSIFNRGYSCPNASWNGIFISFCPGFTTDDVTSHEWGHAYTQYTDALIYQWQPGALNESYSDIWGETNDLINGRQTDAPGGPRSTAACSTFSPPVGTLRVNSPAGIAGDYFAQSAFFGPPLSTTGITGDVVAALDPANSAGPSTLDGCSALTNAGAVSGHVAIINRGTCTFVTKVLNAQAAGATAVIIANNVSTGLPGMGAAAGSENVTIPSLGVQQATGTAIRNALTTDTVNATLLAAPGTDASYRWLLGEDVTPGGALRDMWNPTCYSNPAKVSDTAFYVCATGDNGGVHTNSGVPNHAYALLVDGGTYNAQTIAPIGLTKAAHIYFRAQSVYQVEDSDFADHADALEASCADLIGQPLDALTGGPSGETIAVTDCDQVTKAIAAVELRTAPTFCNFPPLLNPALPAFCSTTTTTGVVTNITSFDFESDPTSSWTIGRTGTSLNFTSRDWAWVNSLPSPNAGSGFFGPDPNFACSSGVNETGVLTLTSPTISLPMTTSFARATFEHWVATEPGFDGGALNISVNGGPWQVIPSSQITFNSYNSVLITAENGNTNPQAGLPAWNGTNSGFVNQGSWGRSHVNLGNFANAGDSVQLRWDLGSDTCAGRIGWYLDNVNIFSCVPKVPSITVGDIAVAEGDSGLTPAVFTVTLSTPTIATVSVAFTTVDGTAKKTSDYQSVSGTLVIPAGLTSGQIVVNVKGDTVHEGAETFFLQLTAATNATISDGLAQATIGAED